MTARRWGAEPHMPELPRVSRMARAISRVVADLIDCRRVLIDEIEPCGWRDIINLHRARNEAREILGKPRWPR